MATFPSIGSWVSFPSPQVYLGHLLGFLGQVEVAVCTTTLPTLRKQLGQQVAFTLFMQWERVTKQQRLCDLDFASIINQ